uniref:Zinc finger BED domain-containing protein RICESLEEPER 2-like n=1 Tax=Tanacetum cinerariifolium TaxID=118510 RepID=A0A6L2NRK5_TANCI|nr:zinc finger BED domain-containing protein RICESLEEPER 2-like [Tanacetum cinerariifolium]
MASGANNSPKLGATGSSDPHNSNNQSPTEDHGDEQQSAKRKRACKSKVWIDMIKIDNETRAQCIHCKGCYVILATGTTTTLHRHVSNYTEKKKADRQQQLLNFQRVSDEDKGTSSSLLVLATGKYDPTATRELFLIGDARLKVFSQVAEQLHLPDRKLILDSKTRWNSTYKMLSTAITFKEAFFMYEVRDPLYKHCPSDDDWEKLESIYPRCKFNMLELYFKDLYDANEILKKTLELKKILREIHGEYARLLKVRPASSTIDSTSSSHGENVLVGIDKFVFLVDFIVLDMPEDIKTPLILGRPFLSTAHAKIDVFKRKITLRVGNDKVVFKSDKPTSNIIKRVYALSLREKLRRNQVNDLDPTIEECEVVDEPIKDIVKTRCDNVIITGLVVKNMDSYRDERMCDIIVGSPFCKDACIKARLFDGMITIYKGKDNVTYQMTRSHPRSQYDMSWFWDTAY